VIAGAGEVVGGATNGVGGFSLRICGVSVAGEGAATSLPSTEETTGWAEVEAAGMEPMVRAMEGAANAQVIIAAVAIATARIVPAI
jgi:hypothetical protein